MGEDTINGKAERHDGHFLTPIERLIYERLQQAGAVFSAQTLVQGPNGRFRVDFLLFCGAAVTVVELDGHDSHKTQQQRTNDAQRDRWFCAQGIRTVRFTGSEVVADPDGCVRELLALIRA